jgi:hypothetical protein
MPRDQIVENINRYGPWYALISGIVSLFLSTIFWQPYIRTCRRILNSSWARQALERPDHPFRTMHEWLLENLDSRWMRWASIAWSLGCLLGGAIWLQLR